jgi:hypothetical protein
MDVDMEVTERTEPEALAWPELDFDRDETGLDSENLARTPGGRGEIGTGR